MRNAHSSIEGIILSVLCFTLAGCATTPPSNKVYIAPTDFKYFAEYGWMSVAENSTGGNELYKSRILVSYVAYDWKSSGGGEVWHSQRALPETEAEARATVQSNFAELAKSRNEQGPQTNEALETAKKIIFAPVALAFIATLPISYPIEQQIKRNTSTGAPFPEEAKNARSTLHLEPVRPPPVPDKARFDIRVEDRSGNPVKDAKVLVIHSPIRFTAYADAKYRRAFPIEQMVDDYGVSSELAEKLAHHLGREGAPGGEFTDANGRLPVEFRTGMKEYVQLPRMVHFLINKPGYVPQTRSIPAEKVGSIDILPFTLEVDTKPTDSISLELNPWTTTHKLEQYVWHLSRKYADESAWKAQPDTPPPEFDRFRDYALAAYSFAPDYPIVQSAMFFLELESGNREEARKYGRFIDNNIYAKAIYRMIWNDNPSTR